MPSKLVASKIDVTSSRKLTGTVKGQTLQLYLLIKLEKNYVLLGILKPPGRESIEIYSSIRMEIRRITSLKDAGEWLEVE